MTVRTDRFPPTNRTISVPMALAAGALPTGLQAPAYRAFVMLASLATERGYIDLLKPELEKLIATRVDNANAFLDPLRHTMIDMPGADNDAVGQPWFESVEYTPGEQKRLAGVVRSRLSSAARSVLSDLMFTGTVTIDADEFRRLSTVAGIVVYLRCRALLKGSGKAKEVSQRFDDEGLFGLFGQYARSAVSRKRNVAGEVNQTLSLSRMTDVLLEPGVLDVRRNIDDVIVAITVGRAGDGQGRWTHVDLIVAPRPKRMTLRELDADMLERERHRSEIAQRKAAKTAYKSTDLGRHS